ncbi:MAG: hypothetical protein OHK0039_12400 [Bacteroidia bacterium]
MNHTYQLLAALLPKLEQYEQASGYQDASLEGFASWLGQHLAFPGPRMLPPVDAASLSEAAEGYTETVLTMLIAYLYRYAKHYAKKALEGSPLSTLDDFTFLVTLRYQGSLTKSELIHMHLLEITSGTEVIKRLGRQGFVEEYEDPDDRRSKRVKITGAGVQVLEDVMEQMDKVARIVTGNLDMQERAVLLPMLHRLNDFHSHIHRNDRRSDLATIEQKYIDRTEADETTA